MTGCRCRSADQGLVEALLLEQRLLQDPGGQCRRLPGLDLPAHDLAAVAVDDESQVVGPEEFPTL